jgi:pimeloyl-ACP methyl ester carboxylesterase
MKLGPLSLALLLSSAVVGTACAPEDGTTKDDGNSKKKTSSKDDTDDDDDDTKKDDPKTEDPKEAPVDPLTFAACTEPYSGDCATVQLPVDRTKPDGDTIEIFVTRFANPSKPRGALWLLQGGPGGSVSGFEAVVAEYKAQFPDLTIYGLEHRGVGRSTKLDPIQSEQSIDALKAKWGDKLGQFSTTGASNDLHEVIRRTRRGDEPVYVYGVSYGTYWAQRYLTMFPKEPAGVVLDSVVPMQGLYFSKSDEEGGAVAKYWAELCDADTTCAGKFGGAPTWPKLQASFAKFGTAHCPAAGMTRERLTSLRGLLTFNEFGFAILPVARRFERCTTDDVAGLR